MMKEESGPGLDSLSLTEVEWLHVTAIKLVTTQHLFNRNLSPYTGEREGLIHPPLLQGFGTST